MIKALIFDLDDTLYDEIDFVESGFLKVSELVSENKHAPSTEVIKKKLWDNYHDSKNYVFNNTLKQLNIKFDERSISYLINLYKYHDPNIIISIEVINLLKDFKSDGYKLGIITDGDYDQQANKIKALRLNDFFDFICITDSFGRDCWKPHPLPYIHTINNLDVNPEEAIYIGDNQKKDFVTAKLMGIKTIQYCNARGIHKEEVILYKDYFKSDQSISDLKEIKFCLKNWT